MWHIERMICQVFKYLAKSKSIFAVDKSNQSNDVERSNMIIILPKILTF